LILKLDLGALLSKITCARIQLESSETPQTLCLLARLHEICPCDGPRIHLGEFGGYNYKVGAFLFIISGVLGILFAVGLMSALTRSLSSVTGTILLILHAVFDDIGSGIFPCDFGGLHESFSGQMHLLLSAIGMLALLLAPYFLWRAFYLDSRFSGSRLANFTALIAFIITGVVIAGIAAGVFNIPFITNLAGLGQRSVYFPYYLWILVVSIKMLKDEQYH
jgi:hypothetical protein